MSYPMTQLGSRAISHYNASPTTDEEEREYDRLRDLARSEARKRAQLSQQSQQAYQSGNKAAASDLSKQAKKHAAKMDEYNRQARDYIFRANNHDQPEDTIDLHGLFVEEAEEILEQRIRAASSRGEEGLHVIVGKGNHSTNHVRKLAPAVERICQEQGLKHKEEENEGRIYIWLRPGTGGENVTPPGWGQNQQQHHHHQQQNHHQQPNYHQQPQGGYPGHQQQQQHQQPDLVEEVAKAVLPKIFKKMGECCVIM
ncbi:Similar to Smr domain-containing protein C11H11.03c; acc. no. Q9UTP4 [Pyronema omphalodes CBS 100304]|uniref:Similar to Smr domain-containing protein C11H11.03c acc. no. Q9UTP4 n=1 Tax=Pyronema omphalodes (strain CBS 100304) TaxID=1076935 RepID=U4LUD0_PYROM|nr:Similar to Smr domain-containing protein C11H11.03c; acc. no. Q9UTP4 [Pyronema omphalodes CBS 100304]